MCAHATPGTYWNQAGQARWDNSSLFVSWVYNCVVKAGRGGGGGGGGLCPRKGRLQDGGTLGDREGLAVTACPGKKEGETGSP